MEKDIDAIGSNERRKVKVMSEERTKLEARPKSLRVSDLQRETKQHLQILRQDENTLSYAYEIFAYRERVWPDQCKHIAILMQRLQKPVQTLFLLLEQPAFCSASIASHRHLLLMTLQHVDEQITELPPLITRFQSSCRAPTSQSTKQKEEIQQRLKILQQAYSKTLEDISALSDMLYFQRQSIDAPSHTAYQGDSRKQQL